jgi:hypothetical protein
MWTESYVDASKHHLKFGEAVSPSVDSIKTSSFVLHTWVWMDATAKHKAARRVLSLRFCSSLYYCSLCDFLRNTVKSLTTQSSIH